MEPGTMNAGSGVDRGILRGAIPDASPLPVAVVAGVGNIIRYVNSAFCTLAGQSENSVLGVAFNEAVPAGSDCLALLDRVYRTSQAEAHIGNEKSGHSL